MAVRGGFVSKDKIGTISGKSGIVIKISACTTEISLQSLFGKLEGPVCRSKSTRTVAGGRAAKVVPATSSQRQVQRTEDISGGCPASVSSSELISVPEGEVEVNSFAGRLKDFYRAWSNLTSDPFVLSCIEGYKIRFHTRPTQSRAPPPCVNRKPDNSAMQREIEHLLEIGAIKSCAPSNGQFLSSFFLVTKPNGKNRFVLNLKKLNTFIDSDHFKLEDIRTAIKLLSVGSHMATIDLKEAYFLVPVHKDSKRYLRFLWEGKIFEFQCLPFGLCTAPWVFSKLMKPVAKRLRSRGWLSVVYLDDWLLIGDNFAQCKSNIEETASLLSSLGFIINENKSSLVPAQQCQFLGCILDSVEFQLRLPEEKKKKILDLLNRFKTQKSCKIREFAHFVGTLAAACRVTDYGWCYLKPLERQKFLALVLSGNDYEARMEVPTWMHCEFSWWISHIPFASMPIRRNKFTRTIFSDASLSGWGAVCNGNSAHGFWKESEQTYHINSLELLAIYFALKSFARDLKNCEILLRVDNTTAISYINRMGGIKFPLLNKLSRKIWQWCERRGLWIFASYIASQDNVEADRASRIKNVDTEWELSQEAFQIIIERFASPVIDLFASRRNTKCKNFYSWHNDPEAHGVDAFTFCWTSDYFYAFPPFNLLLRVINKIWSDQACGIVVAPVWTTQPWYPLWEKLLVDPPIVFEPNDNLLLSPCRRVRHPLASNLRLMAGKLSGKHLQRPRYHSTQYQL